jgi:hypothetical protein
MPWAASTLYLGDTPAARDVVRADPHLAGHVFAVDLGALEHGPHLRDGASGRLLVIRSPGRVRDLPMLVHGFDWSKLDGVLAPRLAAFRRGLGGPASRIAPPDRQLRWIEDLAARVCGPVCWYMAEAPEGDPDAELCWVVDWAGPALYTRQERTFVRIDPTGSTPSVDPLTAALRHHGAELDSPWFAPHSPGFDWEACRLELSA